MDRVLLLAACVPIASATLAAEPPPAVRPEPVATKKELLISDDFEGAQPAKAWHEVVPAFAFDNRVLKGTQTRNSNEPARDGKPAVTAHAAVYGLDVATKDSVVEVGIRCEGATMMDVEFDHRAYTGSHYGHICRAQVRLNGVTLIDKRDGSMRNDVYAIKQDPTRRQEVARLLKGRSATFPAKLQPDTWYMLAVETAGDEMRVTINGLPAGYLQSSGIAHATKSTIELGVEGKAGSFDDIKVWNAEPAKP